MVRVGRRTAFTTARMPSEVWAALPDESRAKAVTVDVPTQLTGTTSAKVSFTVTAAPATESDRLAGAPIRYPTHTTLSWSVAATDTRIVSPGTKLDTPPGPVSVPVSVGGLRSRTVACAAAWPTTLPARAVAVKS